MRAEEVSIPQRTSSPSSLPQQADSLTAPPNPPEPGGLGRTSASATLIGEAESKATRRWLLLVGIACVLLHVPAIAQRHVPNTWLYGDGAFYFTTLKTLVTEGQFEQRAVQPRSWYEQDLGWNRNLTDDWSNVALGRDGRWYPKHPVLLPVLSIPFFWVFGTVGTLVLNAVLSVACVLLVFLLCRRFCPPGPAALVAVLFAAQPATLSAAYGFSNDLLGSALILGALELVLSGRAGLAGVLAGFSLWTRVTHAIFLPTLVLAGVHAVGWRGVLRASLFALLPLGTFGALNTWMFGVPWVTPYQMVLVRENGVMTTASHSRLFTIPVLEGLRAILFGKDSVFRAWPAALPGLVGLVLLLRRRPILATAAVLAFVLPVLTYAPYRWYRSPFLHASAALAIVGLGVIAAWVFPSSAATQAGASAAPTASASSAVWWTSKRRRVAWATALLAILTAGSIRSFVTRGDPALLSTRIEEARVFLGTTPCDYWNPNHERWECSHHDSGAWAMTGNVPGESVRVDGAPARGIWLHPHPSGRWRRLVFDTLDVDGASAREVELDVALGDRSRAGEVTVEVKVAGQVVATSRLSQPGERVSHRITLPSTPEGDAPLLEIATRALVAEWKHVLVEGRLSSAVDSDAPSVRRE